MIKYEYTRIRKYESFIREILNSTVARIDWVKLEEKEQRFTNKIRELFRLDNDLGWSFYCASLDTIGDSNLAIVSFQNYKLRLANGIVSGDQYLRLYGLLNAVYVNYGAIITLADLVKIKSKELEDSFKNTSILFIRNALAAHPTNFNSGDGKVNYKIVRCSIRDEKNVTIVNHVNESKKFNLIDSVDEYIRLAEDVLHKICLKLIQIRFESSKAKIDDLAGKLEKIKHNSNNGF